MATYYVNNLTGSDSNDGLSEGAPFLTLNKLNALTGLLANDIVRVKATGTNYVLTDNGTNTAVDFFRDSTPTSRTVFLTNWIADGDTRPKIVSLRSLINTSSTWQFNCSIKNIDFEIDDLTVTTNGWNLTPANTGASTLRKCYFNYIRTGGNYTNTKNIIASGLQTINDCDFNFNNGYSLISITGVSLFYNNIVRNVYGATTVSVLSFAASAIISKNIFHNIVNTSAFGSSGIFTNNSGTGVFSNNVVVINDITSSTTACRVFPTSTNFSKCFANIFINNRTLGSTYFSSSLTQSFPTLHNLGNNAFKDFTGIWNGGTLSGYPTPADESAFGANITLSGSPFLSDTFGNADFAKLDDTNADGLACIAAAFYDPNVDLGRYQTTGGGAAGETDPNKVLNTSTIITGNYIPVAATDVNFGVSFGLSETGTKRDTSPTEDKVVADETWYSNSVLKTGTRTSIYPLLPLNVVQYQVDRGDGQFGTDKGENFNTPITANILKTGEVILSLNNSITGNYIATEFYTNLAEADVIYNVPYKYQSLTNNKLGKYHKAIAADVRFNTTFGIDNADTGLLNLPSVDKVVDGTAFDNATKTGNVRIPSAIDVRENEVYDSTNPALEKTGILNVEAEANLPLESNVLAGTNNYGPNLDKEPLYSPDFPNKANVTSDDTVNGEAGLINKDYVLVNMGGNWVKADASKYQFGQMFGINGTSETGSYSGTGTQVPLKVIRRGYNTGYGLGTLGAINEQNMDVTVQIKNNIENNVIIPNLPVGWVKFEHLYNPEDNNFKTNHKRYGVLIDDASEAPYVTGQETIARSYTIRLMNRFIDKGQNDSQIQIAKAELLSLLELIRRVAVVSDFGNYGAIIDANAVNEPTITIDMENSYLIGEIKVVIIYTVDKI